MKTARHGDPQTVRAARIYRRLLVLYPASFRRQYTPPMIQLFKDQYRGLGRVPSSRELGRFWIWMVADTVSLTSLRF